MVSRNLLRRRSRSLNCGSGRVKVNEEIRMAKGIDRTLARQYMTH